MLQATRAPSTSGLFESIIQPALTEVETTFPRTQPVSLPAFSHQRQEPRHPAQHGTPFGPGPAFRPPVRPSLLAVGASSKSGC
jgi:hypothetical protein